MALLHLVDGYMPKPLPAEGSDRRYTGARSVTTSIGLAFVVPMACSKKRRAALPSPWAETKISMTWPNWSMARKM